MLRSTAMPSAAACSSPSRNAFRSFISASASASPIRISGVTAVSCVQPLVLTPPIVHRTTRSSVDRFMSIRKDMSAAIIELAANPASKRVVIGVREPTRARL